MERYVGRQGRASGGVWEDLEETLERMVSTGGGSLMSTGGATFSSGTPPNLGMGVEGISPLRRSVLDEVHT